MPRNPSLLLVALSWLRGIRLGDLILNRAGVSGNSFCRQAELGEVAGVTVIGGFERVID
jgi:hypothetical protein